MKNSTAIGIPLVAFILLLFTTLALYGSANQAGTPFSYSFLLTISQITLTHADLGDVARPITATMLILNLIITQLSGLLFFSVLFYFCLRLFGTDEEKALKPRNIIAATALALLIGELLLSLFFLYGLSKSGSDALLQSKILTSLTLAINVINQAGFSNWRHFFDESVMSGDLIIQMGVLGGSLFGGLGMYAIYELFSPYKLRQRLANPAIDWSFITKWSVFGSAAALLLYLLFYFLVAKNSIPLDKTHVESLAFVMMEGIGARGWGLQISEATGLAADLNVAMSYLASAPFSPGGGASLLILVFGFALFRSKAKLSTHVRTGYGVIMIWLPGTSIILLFAAFFVHITNSQISIREIMLLYSNHHVQLSYSEHLPELIIKALLLVVGRWSLIVAAYLYINHQNLHASRSF
jgi:hypothetical protein